MQIELKGNVICEGIPNGQEGEVYEAPRYIAKMLLDGGYAVEPESPVDNPIVVRLPEKD